MASICNPTPGRRDELETGTTLQLAQFLVVKYHYMPTSLRATLSHRWGRQTVAEVVYSEKVYSEEYKEKEYSCVYC